MYERSVGYQLKRAQHALRLALDAELGGLGLSTGQYAALAALKQYPKASSAALARYCFVTPQTMTGLVRGLHAAELLERGTHPSHGRIVVLGLTDKGTRLLAEADRRAGAVERKMLSAMNATDRRRFGVLLQQSIGALSRATKRG